MIDITYFAAYDGLGNVIGLYNTHDHKDIPCESIVISLEERDKIVATPGRFKVNAKELKLTEVRAENVDPIDALRSSAFSGYRHKINRGFAYNNYIFSASDEACANLTQCLAIIALDETFVPELHLLSTDGTRFFVSVDKETLIAVAKGVHKLRFSAAANLNLQLNNRGI